MPLWPNFVGPAYSAQDRMVAADLCYNLYLETTKNAADPKKAVLYGTPGLRMLVATGQTNTRGMFSQDGRVFIVQNSYFFEYVPATNSWTNFNSGLADDGKRVTFASNGMGGNQLAVCSAGSLYIFNLSTNIWTGVSLPFVPVMVGFMDGYFLANEKNTVKMWFSNLENGLVWSATDFFARSSTSDNIVGFAVNNRRIWVLGSKTTEIFQDSGDPTTPFIPYPGTVINEGTQAYASIVSVADTVLWTGSTNEFGASQVFAAATLQPRAISTPAISAQIALSTDATEAEGMAYTQHGHDFICWTWPSLEQTWCYDLTEGCWHQRAATLTTDPTVFALTRVRWPARCCCAYNPTGGGQPAILAGQWTNGSLCQLDLTYTKDYDPTYTGNERPILRDRVAPYISPENQWLFLYQLELGIGEPDNSTDPLPDTDAVVLFLHAWNHPSATVPQTSVPLKVDGVPVVQWFQLGRWRTDRLIIAMRSFSVRPAVWGPGLWIRATPGSGLL